jgi:hypothetical protein
MEQDVEKLRAALLAQGYVPKSITPGRGPDGKVVMRIAVLKDPDAVTPIQEPEPEQMIAQPAPDLAQFRDFELIPGVGAKTAEKLRNAGLRSLQKVMMAPAAEVESLVGPRAFQAIDAYLREHYSW